MNRLLYLLGTSAGGWAGWWLGSTIGIMTGFMLGVAGTAVGLWATRRLIAEYMS